MQLKVPFTGILGFLLLAKQRGLLDKVIPLVEGLRSNGYWLSDRVVQVVRQLAGEYKKPHLTSVFCPLTSIIWQLFSVSVFSISAFQDLPASFVYFVRFVVDKRESLVAAMS